MVSPCLIFMLEMHFNIVISIQKQNLTVECCLIFFFRDFLPRGSGIVTRRPLVLQLVNCPTGKNPRKTHTHTHKKKRSSRGSERCPLYFSSNLDQTHLCLSTCLKSTPILSFNIPWVSIPLSAPEGLPLFCLCSL